MIVTPARPSTGPSAMLGGSGPCYAAADRASEA